MCAEASDLSTKGGRVLYAYRPIGTEVETVDVLTATCPNPNFQPYFWGRLLVSKGTFAVLSTTESTSLCSSVSGNWW